MKNIIILIAGTITALSLNGCQTAVDKPSKITLVDAMTQLGAGFSGMRIAENGARTGLIPDTADVTFNIGANSSDSKSLTVDLKGSVTPPQIPVNISADLAAALSHAYTSSRGSQVTIHFVNVMTINPSNTMVKSLDDLQKASEIIRSSTNTDLEIMNWKKIKVDLLELKPETK